MGPSGGSKSQNKCDESSLIDKSFSTIPPNLQSDLYSKQACFDEPRVILSPQNQTEISKIEKSNPFSNPLSPREKSGKPLTKINSSKLSFGMRPGSRTARELTLNQQNSNISKGMSAESSGQKNSLRGQQKS